MNEILNDVFEVSGNLELTQKLIVVLINMVEKEDVSTPNGAMYFVNQQDEIGALLHIALDYVFNAKVSLEKLQDRKVVPYNE